MKKKIFVSKKAQRHASRGEFTYFRVNKHAKKKTYWGTHKKVSVGVYTDRGFITTIFPNYVQKGERKYGEKEKRS